MRNVHLYVYTCEAQRYTANAETTNLNFRGFDSRRQVNCKGWISPERLAFPDSNRLSKILRPVDSSHTQSPYYN
jgi:hypothetical protein